MADFFIKQNDRREPLERILLGSDDLPVDLTGASVKFFMRGISVGAAPGVVKIDGVSATVVGPPVDGRVRYSWASGDTDTAGRYEGEFEVTYGDGTKETFPNTGYLIIQIGDDIG